MNNYKKICLLGEMKELGDNSSSLHSDICQYAEGKVDYLFCIGEDWKGIKGSNKTNFKILSSHDELYEIVKELINENTVTLVKGSRSTRMDIIADKLKI